MTDVTADKTPIIKTMPATSQRTSFDKYRGIILSIALFIVLDASVLTMNFFISFQVAEDAEAVNVAGRQRMLSQRIMKSLLETQANLQSVNLTGMEKPVKELENSSSLFQRTLDAFVQGKNTLGTSGKEITLTAVKDEKTIAVLRQTLEEWQPLYQAINNAIVNIDDAEFERASLGINKAVALGQGSNLTLLALMNDLTNDLEQVAFSKASLLRWIQTVGILLAVLNFFIIMRHFIRQLRDSDKKIAAAQKETTQILENVDEGLFLMDKDLVMSDQHSAKMLSIFQKPEIAGSSFTSYIKDAVSAKTVETAGDYLDLMFDKSKKQRLLGDLNPLKQVAIQTRDNNDSVTNKYLRFSFSRVQEGKEIKRVLATVSDITNETVLAQELENSQKRNTQQMEMLSTVLNAGSGVIPLFLDSSNKVYRDINDVLKRSSNGTTAYQNKANELLALIHGVKGDASAISLTAISDLCFELEMELKKLKKQPNLAGRDFLKSTILLEQLISYNDTMQDLFDNIFSGKNDHTDSNNIQHREWGHLADLAQDIAARQGKIVEFMSAGLNDHVMNDEFAKKISTIAVQLIRNSLAHGIETPIERTALSQADKGTIKLILTKRDNGHFELTLVDDGAGLNKTHIINKALEQGIISPTQAKDMTIDDAIPLMFHPDLSTSDNVDQDSGQGMGMFLVRKIVKESGGKIAVRTIKNNGIRFIISLPQTQINTIQSAA